MSAFASWCSCGAVGALLRNIQGRVHIFVVTFLEPSQGWLASRLSPRSCILMIVLDTFVGSGPDHVFYSPHDLQSDSPIAFLDLEGTERRSLSSHMPCTKLRAHY